MRKEVAEKWVKALRSGEFLQGKTQLRSENHYCCLGVLCELYRQETGNGEWTEKGFCSFGETLEGLPPMAVRDWAGLCSLSGTLSLFGNPSLVTMNDSLSKSFEQLADYIEKYQEEL